jgi:membrane dipeptidase
MAGAGGVADCVVPADPPVAPKYADWDESSGFDVDAFLAEILVIDGNANYFTPGTEIGEPDFGADENGLSVKASTFIDVGCITLDADYYAREKTRLADGTYSGARLIERYADIELSRSQGEYGVVFYTQKHSPLAGSVANLGAWHTDGLRVFQLAYGSGTNETPEERLGGGSDQEGGLTALGAAVVEGLLRLGIVVDLSHTNEQTTLEAAAVARERCVPVIANHAPAYALRVDDRYTRGKTDDEIVAVADTGGVVGVFTYGPWIERTEGMDADISDAVAHIDYMVSLVGVDHVGVATDGYLDGSWTPDADDNPQTSGDGLLDSPARYRYLAQALFDAGYSPLAIEKIFGLNFLRVYRAVWN